MGADDRRPISQLPVYLKDKVAIDVSNMVVHVDKKHYGDPQLLSWHHRNQIQGYNFKIVATDMDEVARLISEGKSLQQLDSEEISLTTRNAALDILYKAAAYHASDIHFMMRGTYTEVQLNINNHLYVLTRLTQAEGDGICRAIYQGIAKVRDDSYKQLEFQNAQIPGDGLNTDHGINSVRIVRGPSYPVEKDGGFMTLRLQYTPGLVNNKGDDLPPLEHPKRPPGKFMLGEMGFDPKQVIKLKRLMDSPSGMIIFTGPTGSGKTNSIYEMLQEIARSKPYKRQVTAEDPIEFPMEWAVQLPVINARNDKETGDQFSECLRVELRMAPDILMVGEMRGPEVVVAALEASLTGHQIFTTLHVTDPFLFVDRLELMDRRRIDRKIFCDHKIIRGVVGQRLLRKLCPHCSQRLIDAPEKIEPHVFEALKTWGDISKVRIQGKGCPKCKNSGAIGRFAVSEIVIMDDALMTDFIKYGTDVARANYRKREDADCSMLERAIQCCLEGMVDPVNVQDKVDLILPK